MHVYTTVCVCVFPISIYSDKQIDNGVKVKLYKAPQFWPDEKDSDRLEAAADK